MDPILDPQDPTIDQAMQALDTWEKDSPAPAPAPEQPADSVNEPTTPAPETDGDQTPKPETAEGTPTTETKPEQKPAETKPETKVEPTKYEKAQARITKTWEEINREKDLVRTTSEALKAREAQLAQREQAIASRESKLTKPRFQPDDYDNHASKLEAEAEKVEDSGDYTKADRMRYDAEKAREYAKELRANPPKPDPTEQQQRAAYQTRQKEWWGKAAVDFPGVVKEGSVERSALLSLLKTEPDIVNDPKGMYYASRLVTAEASAARVPQLVKDLETAQARLKELEEQTAIPSDGSAPLTAGGPKPFSAMSPDEQMAQLEAEARSMSGN